MDWNAAIERNREALKRILASLVAMAGSPQGGRSAVITLPRHLHRAVLRLLRPAEAAARRLVIVAARGVVVPPPAPPRPRKPQPKSAILRNGIGTGILLPPGMTSLSPSPGSGGACPRACQRQNPGPLATLSPRGEEIAGRGVRPLLPSGEKVAEPKARPDEGVRTALPASGEGDRKRTSYRSLPLFDPLPRWRRSRPAASGVPRILFPGFSAPSPTPGRRPLSPGDPIDAARLALRLAALASALDDLPKHATRFARWRARMAQNLEPSLPLSLSKGDGRVPREAKRVGCTRRLSPLRPGRPPGQRPARSRRPAHEVHDVLNTIHGLAFWALERPDTS